MIKLLFNLAVIALVGYIIYVKFFKSKTEIPGPTPRPESKNGEDVMMECAKCKTFVSSKDSIVKDGFFYCSKECAQLK